MRHTRRQASYSFALSSIHQELAIVHGLTCGGEKTAGAAGPYARCVAPALLRLSAVTAGFMLTLDETSMKAERDLAKTLADATLHLVDSPDIASFDAAVAAFRALEAAFPEDFL